MSRQLTRAAQAAKIIRTALKSTGLGVKVTSENYAGGSSIRVKMTDQNPEVKNLVQQMCARFCYGEFDGMTDCYNVTNHRRDIPQVKFIFVDNELTDTLRAYIFDFVRRTYAGGDELPESYEQARNIRFHDLWVSDFVYRQFAQSDSAFWESRKQRQIEVAA